MEFVLCLKCNVEKPIVAFAKNSSRKSGRQFYCRVCHSIKTKNHYQNNKPYYVDKSKSRRELVNQLKSNPCTDCGQMFPACAMDFDHVYGEKEFNISQKLGVSVEHLLKEVAKCELVCSNCHRIRTSSRPSKRRSQSIGSRLASRRVSRPSREEFEQLIKLYPASKIASWFGVSGRAVGKWCKSYDIVPVGRGQWGRLRRKILV